MLITKTVILLNEAAFYMLGDLQVFADVNRPKNVIPYKALKENGDYLELPFDTVKKNLYVPPKGMEEKPLPEHVVLIRFSKKFSLFHKDNQRHETGVKQVNDEAKEKGLGYRLLGRDRKKQMQGKDVTVELENDHFRLVIKNGKLIHTIKNWRIIALEHLERVPDTLDLILEYHRVEQRQAFPMDDPKDVIRLRLPGLGILQTAKSAVELNESPVFHLVDHPLPMHIVAIRPGEEVIKENVKKKTESKIKGKFIDKPAPVIKPKKVPVEKVPMPHLPFKRKDMQELSAHPDKNAKARAYLASMEEQRTGSIKTTGIKNIR